MSVKFLESHGVKKHILLIHTNTDRAKRIQLDFIKNGLVKKESCVFLINHDTKISQIKKEMKQNGINVKMYEDENRLHIYKIPQLDKGTDGIWFGFKKFAEQILNESRPPYRIVGRIISNVNNEFGMDVQMVIEKNVHAIFDDLNASVLCHYDTREIPQKNQSEIIKNLCKTHHIIIEIDGNKEFVRQM